MTLSLLSEADLHGFVDGHLEPSRRSDVLKRLGSAPADRARIEAWQEQTDLLRAAFFGVEREPIPAALDLAPKTRLHCVSSSDAAILHVPATPVSRHSSARAWIAFFGGIAAATVGGVWYIAAEPNGRDVVVADLRGSVDGTLTNRTSNALTEVSQTAAALPTTTIPDLAAAGFTLVGAESRSSEPASLLFRYKNANSERVVISVARTVQTPMRQPVRTGDVVLWHSHANAYAIAGTIKPERLQAIATALQADDAD